MNINGLPPIDIPLHQRDPHDCRKCVHSYYDIADASSRYVRCGRTQSMCVYERHETGDCTPEALFFKERAI